MKNRIAYSTNLSVLRENAEKKPNSAKAQLRLGTALIKTGFLTEGEKTLERAVEIDPECVEAWVNLGGARLTRWDFDGCVRANQEALKIDPNLTAANFNLGLGYLYQGDSENMLQCFQRVLENDSQNAAAHYYLAVGLNSMDRFEEAYQQLSIAVSMGFSPDPAFIKDMEKKYSDKQDFVQIIEVGPDDSPCENNDSSQRRKEQSNA